MLTLALIFIFLVVAGATWWVGLWGNVIALINILIAGWVATGYYKNLAAFIITQNESLVFLAPFVSFWMLFFLFVGGLRMVTDSMSKYQMKFNVIVEMIGRSVFCLVNAALVVNLVAFAFYLSPIPERPGLRAEKLWVNLSMYWSLGPLSESRKSVFNDNPNKLVIRDQNTQYANYRPFSESMFYAESTLRNTAIRGNSTLLFDKNQRK